MGGDHVMGPQPSLPREPASARATGASILFPELPSARLSLRLGTDTKASWRLCDFAVMWVSPHLAQFTHSWPSTCQPMTFGEMGAGPPRPHPQNPGKEPERLWALSL